MAQSEGGPAPEVAWEIEHLRNETNFYLCVLKLCLDETKDAADVKALEQPLLDAASGLLQMRGWSDAVCKAAADAHGTAVARLKRRDGDDPRELPKLKELYAQTLLVHRCATAHCGRLQQGPGLDSSTAVHIHPGACELSSQRADRGRTGGTRLRTGIHGSTSGPAGCHARTDTTLESG